MSYQDLVKAREERAEKDAAKEAKKATQETDKAAGKGKRGRNRKSAGDAQEPEAKVPRVSDA
jgi:hypothetical protein